MAAEGESSCRRKWEDGCGLKAPTMVAAGCGRGADGEQWRVTEGRGKKALTGGRFSPRNQRNGEQRRRRSGDIGAAAWEQRHRSGGIGAAASERQRRSSGIGVAASEQWHRSGGVGAVASERQRRRGGVEAAASERRRRSGGVGAAASEWRRRIGGIDRRLRMGERRESSTA